jgi:DNA-binding transcriptional ArsR family regulator
MRWWDARREHAGPMNRKQRPFPDEVAERLADAMFALSTSSRVQIMGCLLDGPHAVSDITDALGMEQSAVSHQLRVLRDHALGVAERDGRRRVYALADEHVRALFEEALRHVTRPERKRPRAVPGPTA